MCSPVFDSGKAHLGFTTIAIKLLYTLYSFQSRCLGPRTWNRQAAFSRPTARTVAIFTQAPAQDPL